MVDGESRQKLPRESSRAGLRWRRRLLDCGVRPEADGAVGPVREVRPRGFDTCAGHRGGVVPSELTGCVRRARAELDGLRRGKDNVALSSGADDDGVSPPGQKLLNFYLTVASVLALICLREFRLRYAVDFCRLDSVKGRVRRPIRLQRGWQRLLQRRSKVLSNSIWGEMQPNRQMGSGFVVKSVFSVTLGVPLAVRM